MWFGSPLVKFHLDDVTEGGVTYDTTNGLPDLQLAMGQSAALRVLVATGYYDTVVPWMLPAFSAGAHTRRSPRSAATWLPFSTVRRFCPAPHDEAASPCQTLCFG